MTKYENLALEIKNIWKLCHLSRRSGHQELLKYLENIGSTKNILKGEAKSCTIINMSHSMQIPRTHPMTLRDR
jgi:hypothetical protein